MKRTACIVCGMVLGTRGTCGMGDYALQDMHSTDETMADVSGGKNPWGGFQLAGGGPVPELVTSTLENNLAFRERMLNVVAASGASLLGPEVGNNGGGAMNALRLSVGGGAASLGVELRSLADGGIANVAVVVSSLGVLAAPGIQVFGAFLLVVPDALFEATARVWNGALSPSVFVFTSEGVFTGQQLAIPASAAGAEIFTQGLVIEFTSLAGHNTNVVRTSLSP